jgi:hypothetical protein
LQGQHTRPPRQPVVVAAGAGVLALVEELEVARIDGLGLVGVVRTRSPWLMSLVQVAPLLALPAKGLLSLAACGVHEPLRLLDVNERK